MSNNATGGLERKLPVCTEPMNFGAVVAITVKPCWYMLSTIGSTMVEPKYTTQCIQRTESLRSRDMLCVAPPGLINLGD
jgi:hypothetical protein